MEKSEFLTKKPMLLKEVLKPFNQNDYLYELKYDGIRALIYLDKNEIIIKSRNNIVLNKKFPELLSIKKISNKKIIFDGEIISYHDRKISFSHLQKRIHLKNSLKIEELSIHEPVTFICFDILYENKDLTKLPLLKRKKILDSYADTNHFIKSKYYFFDGISLFNTIKKYNLEGIVAKNIHSTYLYNTRTDAWLKIKNYYHDTFGIYGYLENKNNMISLILGEKINNVDYYVGKVLLNKKHELYDKIINTKVSKKNILKNYTNEKKVILISPVHKLEVYYLERTENNFLRHPFIKN